MEFAGFPYAGVDFFKELNQFNNREWWSAHQDVYQDSVKRPFEELLEILRPDFGRTVMFGPKRRPDSDEAKSHPFKEHQGGMAVSPGGSVWYLHLDAKGLMAGGGSYRVTSDQVERFRAAVLDEFSGFELQMIISTCQRQGFKIGGTIDKDATSYDLTHPRAHLLRHLTLHVHYQFGTPPWLFTPKAADKVHQAWNATRPLVEWLDRNVGLPKIGVVRSKADSFFEGI